jgi:hypothetical protein
VPDAWREEVAGEHVEVLPLVDEHAANRAPGWCTYLYSHPDAPEVEFFCGGINSKTPKAAGLWRQGNLLHFGFEQSPAELNETGRALLINSIAYIARFTEDRPISRVQSPFIGPAAADRGVIPRALARPSRDMAYLKYVLADSTYKELEERDGDEQRAWYEQFQGYLHGDENAKIAVDEAALALGVPPNRAEFFSKAIAALAGQKDPAGRARQLLERYAPEGPGAGATAADWQSWWRENKPYSFFSDSGGYRWYIDPLAKHRSVPTIDLRGPARADAPRTNDRVRAEP